MRKVGISASRPPSQGLGALRNTLARKLKLKYLLFLLLLCSGIIPLLIGSSRLISENEEVLKTQEKVILTRSAQALAQNLSTDLARRKEQLRYLGQSLIAAPGYTTLEERLREEWVKGYLGRFLQDNPDVVVLRLLSREGLGASLGPEDLPVPVTDALVHAFEEAVRSSSPLYRFVSLAEKKDPVAIIVVPFTLSGELADPPVLEMLVRLPQLLAGGAGRDTDVDSREIFLIDREGHLLWSGSDRPEVDAALLRSDLVRDFTRMQSVTGEYQLEVDGEARSTLARIVPVEETGWGVVAHRPAAVAFQAVQKMVWNTAVSSLILVVLAGIFALVASHWLSQPIQRLAETSHEIVAGNFNRRVAPSGLGVEIVNLAEDFNRMSDHLESYIEQLRQAAEVNRELFISSIRAFAAAIDAKDPYTRGHSERVASYSRAIARSLNLSQEMQERVWVSAVLHDIGKIGVDDRVLKKRGVLTAEEFEQMKLHPVIGAEITTPIDQLREMIPGIRWHHEAWNGTGYPDGLRGEQIPLIARIIAVADTFDAITTNRPYQNAYDVDYALQTIRKLTGTKFDAKIVTAFLRAYESRQIALARQEAETSTAELVLSSVTALEAN